MTLTAHAALVNLLFPSDPIENQHAGSESRIELLTISQAFVGLQRASGWSTT
jgi:hypothetical protein